jgi:hypothetical protein
MEFIPEQESKALVVPYFDEVTAEGGWRGMSTGKSMETLKSEVTQAIARLGGVVSGFVFGKVVPIKGETGPEREGYQIHYAVESDGGKMVPGRFDFAALPVRRKSRRSRSGSIERQKEKSLKMGLFMARDALTGLWFLQVLSPGFAPLMPWMIVGSGKNPSTLTQLWSESPVMKQLMPPDGSEFEEDGETVEGVFISWEDMIE